MVTFTNRDLATAVALCAALAAAPAAAVATGSLQDDVRSAISDGNVIVTVAGGVATLTGSTDYLSKVAAERVASADPSVERVVNLIDAS